MSGTDQTDDEMHRRPRRWRRVLLLSLVVLIAALAVGGTYLRNAPIGLPDRFVPALESRLSSAVAGATNLPAEVRVDAVRLRVSDQWRPSLEVEGAHLTLGPDRNRVDIPFITAELSRNAMLAGRFRPKQIHIRGTELILKRRPDGQLSLATSTGTQLEQRPTLNALMEGIGEGLERPVLEYLTRLVMDDVSITVGGPRLRSDLRLEDGHVEIGREKGRLTVDVGANLPNGGSRARIETSLSTDLATMSTEVTGALSDIPPQLIAEAFPKFEAISALESTISAQGAGRLTSQGAFEDIRMSAQIGTGHLTLPRVPEPVKVRSVSVDARFDPDRGRIDLDRIAIDSDRLQTLGRGQLSLAGVKDAKGGHVVRLKLQDVFADVVPLIDAPAEVAELFVEARVQPEEMRIDIGQAYLRDAKTGALGRASGHVVNAEGVWSASFDATATKVPSATVLEYWPLLKKGRKARAWVKRNLLGGTVRDATAAIRFRSGEKPVMAVSFAFEDGSLRALRTLPLIENARGYASIVHHRFTATVLEGSMPAPQGGEVSLAGTVFQVQDMRIKGSDGILLLRAQSPLRAALETLSLPPMSIQDSRPLPVGRLSGTVEIDGKVLVPLRDNARIDFDELRFDGELRDFRFSDLAPGKTLRAEALQLTIASSELRLEGSGTLNTVPLDMQFVTAVAKDAPPGSIVTGSARLTYDGLDALGVRLPPNTISGEALANFEMRLEADQPPALRVTSDLTGAVLSIPAVGWRKPAGQSGNLEIEVVLGEEPDVPSLRLSAPGIDTSGRIRLAEGGGFARADLESVRVGNWIDASATLTPRGAGAPMSISLTGGAIDIRRLPPNGGSGGGGPLTLALDEVRIAPDLALREVRGTLLSGGVLTGTLSGRVNGGAPVTVDLAELNGVQGVRVTSGDAGSVLRSAKVAEGIRGGALDLVLSNASPGVLDGTLRIDNSRLVETPAAVDLLSAISIVGALDQMVNGGGLALNRIETRMSVSARGVRLRDGLANGPALGITFDGLIAPTVGQMDIQGVVSPIYMLNAVGEAFSARRGEGLFGFNYRIYGNRSDPVVEVNPLSLLTPGVFRELFRRPTPNLNQ